MFSTPLISCSSGAATVSAITFGFAPGYCARTMTEGGTTSGYWLIGNFHMAIAPMRKTMIESTAAKVGRSTKKRANFIRDPLPVYLCSATRRHQQISSVEQQAPQHVHEHPWR